jgi:hypothetical protein
MNPLRNLQDAYGRAIKERLQNQYALTYNNVYVDYPEYIESLKVEIAAKQQLENLV